MLKADLGPLCCLQAISSAVAQGNAAVVANAIAQAATGGALQAYSCLGWGRAALLTSLLAAVASILCSQLCCMLFQPRLRLRLRALRLPCPHPTPLHPAGFASAQSAAVAQAISDALTCSCEAAPATAQALANAVATAGCDKLTPALAGKRRQHALGEPHSVIIVGYI